MIYPVSDSIKALVLKNFEGTFPLDTRPKQLDQALTHFQFCDFLVHKLVEQIAERSTSFTEHAAGAIYLILRDHVKEATKEKFYQLYQFGNHSEDYYTINWSSFLSSVRFKALLRVEPTDALCLQHLTHLSSSQKEDLYWLSRSLFGLASASWHALNALLEVKERIRQEAEGGHDAYCYIITPDSVKLENDGDGTLAGNDIIRFELTHDEFQRLIIVWRAAQVPKLTFSSYEKANEKL